MQPGGSGPPGGVSAAAHSITIALLLVSKGLPHQALLPLTHHLCLGFSALRKEEQFKEKICINVNLEDHFLVKIIYKA